MTSSAAAVTSGGNRSLRVLIVEDNSLMARDVAEVVESAGHVVVGAATTAANAVTLATRTFPDLCLMDIQLASWGDGIDAAIEIRARLDIPSVFITAHDDPVSRDRAKHAAPLAFLTKPLDELSLARILAAFLDTDSRTGRARP